MNLWWPRWKFCTKACLAALPLSMQSTTHHIYVVQAEAASRVNGGRTPVVGRLAYWAASP